MRPVFALVFLALPVVAAPVPKALKGKVRDAEGILGTWRMRDHAMDGKRSDSSDCCWRFEPDGKVFCVNTKTGSESLMEYVIDPTGDPKTMEWRSDPKGAVYPSIYKLDGDVLFVVSPLNSTGPRPTEFTAVKGVYFTEFRREPPTK